MTQALEDLVNRSVFPREHAIERLRSRLLWAVGEEFLDAAQGTYTYTNAGRASYDFEYRGIRCRLYFNSQWDLWLATARGRSGFDRPDTDGEPYYKKPVLKALKDIYRNSQQAGGVALSKLREDANELARRLNSSSLEGSFAGTSEYELASTIALELEIFKWFD